MEATWPPCILWVGEKEALVFPHTVVSAIQRVLMSYTELGAKQGKKAILTLP